MKPFIDTLNALRYGQLHDELTDRLHELTKACSETGKVGEITLKIKLKPGKAGQMEIIDELKTKLPEFERGSTILFTTPEGVLQREDPRQLKLEGLRVIDHDTGEIKEVKSA
jgi:hypothetical protein